ncbi:hypothetical protein [Streptomyces formicae]|uniref:Uncharacterized protein n=1 Tax=Streptomyces formicae TaxID=1616117 RepID=A0ABY3WK99_9ACTN|nr:hypothetical protein [Streptomyces formicae]UNM13038.1 hypothetical protein J4032_17370 [Streptomyces formicae]
MNRETDAYIATSADESTVLTGWLREQGLSNDPSQVRPGGTLWIIGHDYEIRDGNLAIRLVRQRGFNPQNTARVVLIVCSSAAVGVYGKGSTAQNIATGLGVPVYGSSIPVSMSADLPMMVDDEDESSSWSRAGAMSRALNLHGTFHLFPPNPPRLFVPGG